MIVHPHSFPHGHSVTLTRTPHGPHCSLLSYACPTLRQMTCLCAPGMKFTTTGLRPQLVTEQVSLCPGSICPPACLSVLYI